MNLTQLTHNAGDLIKKNSPAILTAFGAVGVVTTAYLTAKVSFRTGEFVMHENTVRAGNDETELTTREIIEASWRFYVPVVLTGAASVACIIGAHAVSSRRQAALIGAYTLSERALTEYREKVAEHIGPKKELAVREAIAKDRIDADKEGQEVVILSGNSVICYDVYSGRYFSSDMQTIRKAQNDINAECFQHMYSSLNKFYSLVGLKSLPVGESVGWNTDHQLEVVFSTIISEEDKPVLAVDFRHQPRQDYYSIY